MKKFLMMGILTWSAIMVASGEETAAFARASGAKMRLDTRTGTRIAAIGAEEMITYSPRWSDVASCAVTADGAVLKTASEEGEVVWSPNSTGAHTLTHTAGGETLTAQFTVLGDDVAQHAGALVASETWKSNQVHLVTGDVTVSSGKTLTIEPGAVVKFMTGTALTAEGACTAKGVIFTHVNDDTAGGDTLMDGDAAKPVMDGYKLSGNIYEDDATEERYTAPQMLTSSVSGTLRLKGHKVYLANSSITVNSGATLTLLPGAIIKFASGCSLTVNGTLDAQGTRAAPIVFTSEKDDTWGGDTNGDGDKTYPYAGDWHQITGSGTVKMNYCQVLWCSAQNNQGALYPNGGSWTFDNSIVAHCQYDCMRSYGGTFNANNSVFMDSSMGAAPSSGTCRFVNCVFYSLTTAVRWGQGSYYNCIFADIAEDIIDTKFYSSTVNSPFGHCCFWAPNATGDKASAKVGKDGNIYADPKFVDPDNGDFRIAADSPCVDAGDGTVAPEVDYYGQPRRGTPDIGIYEVTEGLSSSVDLVPEQVTSDSIASPGGELRVTWMVKNIGSEEITGSWRDKLVLTDVSGLYSIDLGTVISSGAAAAGGLVACSATVVVPTTAEGVWYVSVHANCERDIFEGLNTTNNVSISSVMVTVAMEPAEPDVGMSGTADANKPGIGKFAFSGEPMIGRINAPTGTIVYFGDGFVPSADSYSARTVCNADGGIIGIPAGTTTGYVMVVSPNGKAVAYSISFESGALAVKGVSPNRLPYSGMTGLIVTGANFDENCKVELMVEGDAGAIYVPEKVSLVSATQLSLMVDCSKLQAGKNYAVSVTSTDGVRTTCAGALAIDNVPPKAILTAKLDVPSTVRQGRTITGYIEYENTGNVDLPAPIFEIVSEGQIFKVDGQFYTNSVKVVGLSAEAPCGTLRPGEPQRLAVQVTCMAATVRWTLKSYTADDAAYAKPLVLENIVRPDWVYRFAQDEGSTYYADMREKVGTTWGEYYANLAAFADDLETTEAISYEMLKEAFVQVCYQEIKDASASKNLANAVVKSSPVELQSTKVLAGLTPGALKGAQEGQLVWLDSVSRDNRYKYDNSDNGDVWWYDSGKWFSATNESVRAKLKDRLSNVLLICHGNHNSIHSEWIEPMAKAAVDNYSAVLAVDWGDWSVGKSGIKGKNPEDTAPYIPKVADVAIKQLRDVIKVKPENLTLVGHSHGGHLAGHIARRYGGVKRMVGLDTSVMWTHLDKMSRSQCYPNAWNGHDANQVEFYKTSAGYSMGTKDSSEVYGVPSFFVSATNDFTAHDVKEDPWFSKHKTTIGLSRALELHDRAYLWMNERLSQNSVLGAKWNGETSWQEVTGLKSALPTKCFAGVVRDDILECAEKNRKEAFALASNLGRDTTHYTWEWGALMGISGTQYDKAMFPAPKKLVDLKQRHKMLVEYIPINVSLNGDDEIKDGEAVSINFVVANLADNLTIDYDNCEEGYFPWSFQMGASQSVVYGIGCSVWGVDISSVSGKGLSLLNAFHTNMKRNWTSEEIIELISSGARYQLLGTWSGHNAFVPASGTKSYDGKGVLSSLMMVDRNGNVRREAVGANGATEEKMLIVAVAGGLTLNGEPSMTKTYQYDLCRGDNYLVKEITVKPGSAIAAQISEGHISYTPKKVNMQLMSANVNGFEKLSGEYVSDVDGNWTAKFNGAKSTSITNITTYVWAGIDCEPVPRISTDGNPNVTFSGRLPQGDDGLPVPSMTYAIGLFVKDAAGLQSQTNFYKFTVCRGTLSDDGEVEDAVGSSSPKSCDPNEMSGPEGVGEERRVKPGDWMTYTIYFENKADAEASAAMVTVTNPLSEWLDWESFEMMDVAFGSQTDTGLLGKSSGTSSVTMDGTNTSVRTEVAVDSKTGIATWFLRIVDPDGDANGWPLDPYAGFLPPNDPETHCGEGRISYRIRVREDAPKGVRIDNSATIVFDYNEPIETDPAWWNKVDYRTSNYADLVKSIEQASEDVTITLDGEIEVPEGDALNIPEGKSVTFVGDGKVSGAVTNNGELVVGEKVKLDYVVLPSGKRVAISKEKPLVDGAEIQVVTEETLECGSSVTISAEGATQEDAQYFRSKEYGDSEDAVDGAKAFYEDGALVLRRRGESAEYPWNIGAPGAESTTVAWQDGDALYVAPARGTASVASLVEVLTLIKEELAFKVVSADGTRTNDVVMILGDDGVPYASLDDVLAANPQPRTVRLFETMGANVVFNAMGGLHTSGSEVATNFCAACYAFPEVVRNGYTLVGWFDGWKAGACEIAEGQDLLSYEPHTLYAVWAANAPVPNGGELSLPDVVNGVANTAIGDKAYVNNLALRNLMTPLYLRSIGQRAFMGCTALRKVWITSARSYENLAPVAISIGQNAFSGCSELEEVYIAAEVGSIGQSAFQNCPKIKRIVFVGDGAIGYGASAFYRCGYQNGTGELKVYMSSEFQEANAGLVSDFRKWNTQLQVVEKVDILPVVGRIDIGELNLEKFSQERKLAVVVKTMVQGRPDADDVEVEYSSDLANWSPLAGEKCGNIDGTVLVEVTVPDGAKGYLRAVVK